MATTLVNGRCSLAAVAETIAELKVYMNGQHWELIRMTPFEALTKVGAVFQDRALLDFLLQSYDDRTSKFRIGTSMLSFRPEDVALVLGLCCSGEEVVFQKKKSRSSFQERYFSRTYERHRDSIKRTLEQVVRQSGEEENFVKLLMVYLMGTVLFPNTSCSVPNWVVDYVDDLRGMGRYAWAQATHKWLMDDVPQAAARVRARCAGEKIQAGFVKGCSIALNIWFYELTGCGNKVNLSKTPRMLCYEKQGSIQTILPSLEGKEFRELVAANANEDITVGAARQTMHDETTISPERVSRHSRTTSSTRRTGTPPLTSAAPPTTAATPPAQRDDVNERLLQACQLLTSEFRGLVARVDVMEGRSHSNEPSIQANEVPGSDAPEVDQANAGAFSETSSEFDDDEVIAVAIRRRSNLKRPARKTKRIKLIAREADDATVAASQTDTNPGTDVVVAASHTDNSNNEPPEQVWHDFIPHRKKYPGHTRLDIFEQELITIFVNCYIDEYVRSFYINIILYHLTDCVTV